MSYQDKYLKYKDIPKIYLNETRYNIALFHGAVDKSETDIGFKVSSKNFPIEIFDGYDYALLGDIHKRQLMQEGGNDLMPALAGQALNTWTPRGLVGQGLDIVQAVQLSSQC